MTDPVIEAMARAIGRVIWGSEVIPEKQWLKAAEAALAAYEKERWQPIETAPKDGTRVILSRTKSSVWCDCKWEKMRRVPDRWASFVGVVPFSPTHWQPKPTPPENSDERENET